MVQAKRKESHYILSKQSARQMINQGTNLSPLVYHHLRLWLWKHSIRIIIDLHHVIT